MWFLRAVREMEQHHGSSLYQRVLLARALERVRVLFPRLLVSARGFSLEIDEESSEYRAIVAYTRFSYLLRADSVGLAFLSPTDMLVKKSIGRAVRRFQFTFYFATMPPLVAPRCPFTSASKRSAATFCGLQIRSNTTTRS